MYKPAMPLHGAFSLGCPDLVCSCRGELGFVQTLVESRLLEQCLMCPALDNASFLDNQDLIGTLNRREAMSDGDDRAPAHQRFESGLDTSLYLRVQGAGGLVQEKVRCLANEYPFDTHPRLPAS